MKTLLIIPAYNEEENILEVCKKIEQYNKNLDYIVINDGSTDNSLEILKENKIKHINLIHNLGIGGAVQTGYKYAHKNNYDIAIQFDGDGQHDITYLPKLLGPIINGQADMCIGTRYLDKTSSKFKSTAMRRLGKNIISFLIKISCKENITDPTSGFRAINREIIEIFANEYPIEYPEPETNMEITMKGYRVMEVPVSMNERKSGKSSISIWKSVDYMVKVCLALLIGNIRKEKRNKNDNKS